MTAEASTRSPRRAPARQLELSANVVKPDAPDGSDEKQPYPQSESAKLAIT